MTIPPDRCGFEFPPELLIEQGACCCWRPVWNDTDRCVWHAEADKKPIEVLVSARADEPEQAVFDGAVLKGLEPKDRISFGECRLRRGDLSEANLKGADFSGADLFAANLADAFLEGADFSDACLKGADLSDAYLKGADLSGANLRGADLLGADLEDADFSDAYLKGADLSSAFLPRAYISGAFLWGADLSGAFLSGAYITGAFLWRADLSGVYLQNTDLSGVFLEDVALSGADLRGSVLSGADLEGADLSGADLEFANLSGADLFEANLSGADLENADLSGADLENADLSNASFFEVNFSGANLEGADLSGADLRRADLRRVNFRETTLVDIRLDQESWIGKPDQAYNRRHTLSPLSRPTLLMSLLRSESETSATRYDSLARTYHALGEAAKENGLVGKARRLRMWERQARQKEAFANGDWSAWSSSVASKLVMGYGISITRISVAILVLLVGCASVYWLVGVDGAEKPLQALDYSAAIFTGIAPTSGPPTAHPVRSIALLEAFAGIVFSVLLGYVLGTREEP